MQSGQFLLYCKKTRNEVFEMSEQYQLNKELAQMLKGGVIMDVTTPEQARIAQEAGACAVMALERIPAYPCGYPRSRRCIKNE